jgi:hypothetical protein
MSIAGGGCWRWDDNFQGRVGKCAWWAWDWELPFVGLLPSSVWVNSSVLNAFYSAHILFFPEIQCMYLETLTRQGPNLIHLPCHFRSKKLLWFMSHCCIFLLLSCPSISTMQFHCIWSLHRRDLNAFSCCCSYSILNFLHQDIAATVVYMILAYSIWLVAAWASYNSCFLPFFHGFEFMHTSYQFVKQTDWNGTTEHCS